MATLTTGALLVFFIVAVALVLFVTEPVPIDVTPVGYQTNLFVYGPGKYEFRDFVRVGGPVQLLLAVVTTVGIATFWGL